MNGKILTANELLSGDVIYFGQTGTWSRDLDEAFVGLDDNAWTWLEQKGEGEDRIGRVVGAYLVEVEKTATGVRPTHIRERIRTLGPTVRNDLGKQAEAIGVSVGPVEMLPVSSGERQHVSL